MYSETDRLESVILGLPEDVSPKIAVHELIEDVLDHASDEEKQGGDDITVVDCGDVIGEAKDVIGNHDRSEKAVRKVLSSGAMPIILGGDHAIPIPVFRALENHGPITLIQVDAHIDWRDVFHGVSQGLSSVIRRASEMDHINEIYQIGLRSAGSARPEERQAALDYGSNLITDIELQEIGMKAILDRIPNNQNYYLTIDADGVDPTIMPAVAGPAPGGVNSVSYTHLTLPTKRIV